MKSSLRRVFAPVILLMVALSFSTLTACSSAATAGPDGDWTQVIDVRTPEEYAAGHVEGAILIDWNNQATFADEFAKLDKSGNYLLYCKSGNRAGQAEAFLTGQGYTVTNGGGFNDMLAAGWPQGE